MSLGAKVQNRKEFLMRQKIAKMIKTKNTNSFNSFSIEPINVQKLD